MLNIALILVAVLALALLAVVAIAAAKPNQFRVERSIEINAPAPAILPLINDLRQQQA